MHVVLSSAPGGVLLTPVADDGAVVPGAVTIATHELSAEIARREPDRPRWVWDDTARWYPQLLADGVRVERCVDLRLSHVILRNSALTAGSTLANAPYGPWDAPAVAVQQHSGTLFDFVDEPPQGATADPIEEFRLQRAALESSASANSLGLLLAAESAGALIAAEMRFAGLPWSVQRHDELLTGLLGPRPRTGERPAKLEAVLGRVRAALDAPELNPDSPTDLMRALRRVGLLVNSTRSWELKKIEHPVIEPLLEYKKLSRLLAANGWYWLDTWVDEGRFRPDYVPGGVVTGRWATSGGGALQLPKQIRGAVVPDEGWKLIVADAAQLEPRILTGLSGDQKMAEAGRGDLYEGIVASGAVATRAEAKVAMLGAMYGATSGEGGRLMPRLTRAFPRAIAMVEAAARAGERGEVVSTRLGRSSPRPGESWHEAQGEANGVQATDLDERRALSQSRSWGRFTRNFIVQGTAAEWALCWMAGLRNRLWAMADGDFADRPHLVFFLHDEVMVHAPAHLADRVAEEVRAAAADAGRLIFGALPVGFPVTVAIVDSYADAK
ncbi:bifunctional 3'-5' exonuclease/DNA polymerase [Glaciihabitans sp. dw_435]|uniref:bifunctional 3'-5' exonuclease/DNA polymerase n=1 Tax=Glaciihabitans sp. dw_435 TaxID=2720081 RepID=UPI001BD3CBAC|nr:bifunctional 3'-5' exonuclease/DNA polymerase [Glaciihabitans sp. dw_435]